MRRIAKKPLLFEPGTDWSYSTATDVLGLIAANLGDGTLGDTLSSYVLDPLGMSDTIFGVADPVRLSVAYADNQVRLHPMASPATVHSPRGGASTLDPRRILDPRTFQSGGSGLAGTAPDFMKFLLALEAGQPVLSAKSVKYGAANRIGDIVPGKPVPGFRFGYFGSVLVDPAGAGSPCSPGTFRWGGVFGATWFIDPSRRLCVAALTNTAAEGTSGQFPDLVRDACYD